MKRKLVECARTLVHEGLNLGATGNVSCRDGDEFLVTPTGLAPERMRPDQIAVLTAAGQRVEGETPTSEWRMHLGIYRQRQDVGAVVHTHSTWASTVSCTRRDIPAFHYMVMAMGGARIRCAPYAAPASESLSELAVAALGTRRACLLANHGAIAVGATLDDAIETAREVEELAHQYALACMMGGPTLLTQDETDELRGIFARYGAPRPEPSP